MDNIMKSGPLLQCRLHSSALQMQKCPDSGLVHNGSQVTSSQFSIHLLSDDCVCGLHGCTSMTSLCATSPMVWH